MTAATPNIPEPTDANPYAVAAALGHPLPAPAGTVVWLAVWESEHHSDRWAGSTRDSVITEVAADLRIIRDRYASELSARPPLPDDDHVLVDTWDQYDENAPVTVAAFLVVDDPNVSAPPPITGSAPEAPAQSTVVYVRFEEPGVDAAAVVTTEHVAYAWLARHARTQWAQEHPNLSALPADDRAAVEEYMRTQINGYLDCIPLTVDGGYATENHF